MRIKLGPTAAALVLCLSFAAPAGAAEPSAPEFKTEIDHFLDQLGADTQGIVKWEGADHVDLRMEGDAAIADFTNARISIGAEPNKATAKRAAVTFDHVEVRRTPAPDGASKLAFVLPQNAVLKAPDHAAINLTLKDATASATIDAGSGRVRASELAFAGARIDDKASGDWVSFGPLASSYKIVAGPNGSWAGPIAFELQKVEFFATQGPTSGAIDRIAYDARSAGPDLVALNKLRDRLDALRRQDLPPDKRLDASLELLPSIMAMFSEAKGELTLAGLTVRASGGSPLVALKKASLGGALTGLSGESAALRITLQHDGLSVAPTLLDPGKVPQRAKLDFGLEDVGTAALRNILEAASKMRAAASEPDKQQAQQQAGEAAATMKPVLRVYDLAVDTNDVGISGKGEAKGSPLSPLGYSAEGDVAVRGFDALAGLVGNAPPAAYLPLLQEIGTPAKADDGSKRLNFHLASTLQKLITVNGNDVTAWFAGGGPAPGQPRDLRPAAPAMSGADVVAVQHALAAAHIAAPQTGNYDGATAAAVARFQKANALNVDGVVDQATRQKLGVKPVATPGAN